jgi:thiol-disulfide isomerase/thioredoxin
MKKNNNFNWLYLTLITSILVSCGDKKEEVLSGFHLTGKIENHGDVNQISVHEITPNGLILLDTANLDAYGNFDLNGHISEKTFCVVRFEKGDIILSLDTNSQLPLNIDLNKIELYSVGVSKENEELKQLYLINNGYLKRSETISQRFSSYTDATLTERVQEEIRLTFDSLQVSHKIAIQEYVGSLNNSIVPYFATSFLLPDADLAFLKTIDNSLYKKFSFSKYANQLHQKIALMEKTAEGNLAPDIVLNDPFGKTVSLSSLRGKIVLVDFWASWCAPCRKENPKNVALYQKYKNSGFEIFGVSLDDNRDSWINAISKDQLLWTHGSDLQKWNSPIVSLYNIDAIPFTILVDKEGKIISKKLVGKDLELKLKEVFGF